MPPVNIFRRRGNWLSMRGRSPIRSRLQCKRCPWPHFTENGSAGEDDWRSGTRAPPAEPPGPPPETPGHRSEGLPPLLGVVAPDRAWPASWSFGREVTPGKRPWAKALDRWQIERLHRNGNTELGQAQRGRPRRYPGSTASGQAGQALTARRGRACYVMVVPESSYQSQCPAPGGAGSTTRSPRTSPVGEAAHAGSPTHRLPLRP